jgi:hypothetical protein
VARNADNSATDLAEDVVATFRWANFGLPSRSSFHKIPTDAVAAARGNPPPAQDIPPTTSATYTFDWAVADEAPVDQGDYTDGSHWCLQVELTSTTGVTFYDSIAQRNMNFADTASPFERRAVISAEGLKPPRDQRVHEFRLEERFYNAKPELKWKSELKGAEKLGNGFYRVKVPVEQPFNLDMAVLAPDKALVPYEVITLGKEETKLEVRPGTLITLLNDVLPEPVKRMALERRERDKQKPRKAATVRAAWGDAKGQKGERSFNIGSATTLKVPRKARVLYLSYDSSEGDKQSKRLRYYATPIEKYHLFAHPSLLNEGKNIQPGLAANLPTVVYRGSRNMGRTLTIGKQRFEVYAPVGSFSYIVRGTKPTALRR